MISALPIVTRLGQEGKRTAGNVVVPIYHRFRFGALGRYFSLARRIPGFTGRDESRALAYASAALPPNATVVEIGSFLGRSSILFAGARKFAGSGHVHCIDPFDGSGDEFSVPYYKAILDRRTRVSQLDQFHTNIRRAGLSAWVTAHRGGAEQVGPTWTAPIDMLFFDGDQSPEGARRAFELFEPHLKRGGIIALHNSDERVYDPGHDGHYRLRKEELRFPRYGDVYCIEATTFARKL